MCSSDLSGGPSDERADGAGDTSNDSAPALELGLGEGSPSGEGLGGCVARLFTTVPDESAADLDLLFVYESSYVTGSEDGRFSECTGTFRNRITSRTFGWDGRSAAAWDLDGDDMPGACSVTRYVDLGPILGWNVDTIEAFAAVSLPNQGFVWTEILPSGLAEDGSCLVADGIRWLPAEETGHPWLVGSTGIYDSSSWEISTYFVADATTGTILVYP